METCVEVLERYFRRAELEKIKKDEEEQKQRMAEVQKLREKKHHVQTDVSSKVCFVVGTGTSLRQFSSTCGVHFARVLTVR